MKFLLDTTNTTLIAGGVPEPVVKNRETGELSRDRDTGQTMFVVHVIALTPIPGEKPQIWSVKVPGEPAGIEANTVLRITGLMASDWENGDRHGISLRAASITPATTPAPAKQPVTAGAGSNGKAAA